MLAISIVIILIIGSLLYVKPWKLIYIDWTKSGWKDAKAHYPRLAQKMNLTFTQSELDYHIGEIRGILNNCQLAVKPDENATVDIRFKTTPELFLSSVDPENIEPYPGMIRFDTSNEPFDRYFRTRFAAPAISSAIQEKSNSIHFVDPFVKKWARPIQRFDITRNGIECQFKYGGQTYIPEVVLRSFLPDLCEFTRAFEDLLMSAGPLAAEQQNDLATKGTTN